MSAFLISTQIIDNHTIVKPSEYTGKAVHLPAPEEIPGVSLEVMNYHRPILGTFHCKFMVVDRKIAIISSNNIQSNDNLEMAVHLEGPIVDSFWDLCLVSWDKELDPPLPCKDSPAKEKMGEDAYPTFTEQRFKDLFDQEGKLKMSVLDEGITPDKKQSEVNNGEPSYSGGMPQFDIDIAAEVARMQKSLDPEPGQRRMDCVAKHLSNNPRSRIIFRANEVKDETTHQDTKPTAPDCSPSEDFCPLNPHPPHASFPITLVNRKPWGAPNHSCVYVPQNEAWLSAIRNAKREVFIQTPNLNASELLPELIAAVKRGIEVTYYVCLGYNDSGELLPMQGGTNEMVASKLFGELEEGERKNLRVHYYVGKDQTKPIHNKFKKRSCHSKLVFPCSVAPSHLSTITNPLST
jgi:phosphatidylserine/phosphatidylglycerophosphate/cardiolipin synthase-like enzyme